MKCLNCGYNNLDNSYSVDEMGAHSSCLECEGSFDIDFPEDAYRIEYCGTSQKKNRCDEGHICYTKKELMTVWKRLFSTYEGTWCTIYDKDGTVIFSGCVDNSGYNAIRKL